MSNKLLSICIPTYNRCKVLEDTLNKLFSNPDFDENKIEVIVSDNCSTDNTTEVVAKFPLVRYYRNEENVVDYNMAIVLGYASGTYIRLFNDTLSFKSNMLGFMLDKINEHLDDGKNLFFYVNMFLNCNCQKKVNDIETYFEEVSFHSTWIINFGIWRKDFLKIEDKNRYTSYKFPQLFWNYQTIKNSKKSIFYFEDFFDVVTPNKKGGYNLIKTFVDDYLAIVKIENLSLVRYEKEKYFLCRYFIFPWLTEILIAGKSKYSFEMNNVFGIIYRKYWYEPYFYMLFSIFRIRKFLFKN